MHTHIHISTHYTPIKYVIITLLSILAYFYNQQFSKNPFNWKIFQVKCDFKSNKETSPYFPKQHNRSMSKSYKWHRNQFVELFTPLFQLLYASRYFAKNCIQSSKQDNLSKTSFFFLTVFKIYVYRIAFYDFDKIFLQYYYSINNV